MVGWVLLIVAPRWRWSAQIIAKFVIPLILAVVYLGVLATHWSGSRGGFGSLAAVGELFSDPWILLAGWVHYLAFDLFLGAWEVRDAGRERSRALAGHPLPARHLPGRPGGPARLLHAPSRPPAHRRPAAPGGGADQPCA